MKSGDLGCCKTKGVIWKHTHCGRSISSEEFVGLRPVKISKISIPKAYTSTFCVMRRDCAHSGARYPAIWLPVADVLFVNGASPKSAIWGSPLQSRSTFEALRLPCGSLMVSCRKAKPLATPRAIFRRPVQSNGSNEGCFTAAKSNGKISIPSLLSSTSFSA